MKPALKATFRIGILLTEIRCSPKYIYSDDDRYLLAIGEPLPHRKRKQCEAIVWVIWPKSPDTRGLSLVAEGEGHNMKLKSIGEPWRHVGDGLAYNPELHARCIAEAKKSVGGKQRTGVYFCPMYTKGSGYPISYQYPPEMNDQWAGLWVTVERLDVPQVFDPLPHPVEPPQDPSLRPGWAGNGIQFNEETRMSEVIDG